MTLSGKLTGLSRRTWIIGAIVALVLVLLFIILAPANNRIDSGSTWSSAPDGYRAWYNYMEEKGTRVERWQRPLHELLEQVNPNTENSSSDSADNSQDNDSQDNAASPPATLLVVLPGAIENQQYAIFNQLYSWFEAGNQAIMLTTQRGVTAAPFSSQIDTTSGAVTIETRRRLESGDTDIEGQLAAIETEPSLAVQGLNTAWPVSEQPVSEQPVSEQSAADIERLLEDAYGAVVWRIDEEAGTFVTSTTPFLAANAYAEDPGNLAFLAELVEQSGGPIYVYEYVHGYKDRDVVVTEVAGSWVNYLAKTPLAMIAAQAGVLLLIGLLAQNRRFGLAKQIPPVQVNNSTAYIQALAGVLHKANNHDFLVETLTRAEQKALQRALGLGDTPVSLAALQTAWQQTTGRSVAELNVLRSAPKRSVGSESALRAWLQRLQALHTAASQRQASPRAQSNNEDNQ